MSILAPFAQPLYVMAKPAGSRCNLACKYCYYLEKEHLYADHYAALPAAERGLMSDETLELFTRQYLESQTQPEMLFTWHGGEPLLRPLSFYRKALKLQRHLGRGRRIDNSLQTNGTLLTDEWCRFFHDEGWLIGISIDGPEELHDAYRRSRGDRPSFARVMRGIELLEKHGVEWNAMGVVNNLNADRALEVYQFYRSIGARFIQFTPIVERLMAHSDGRYLASPDEHSSPTEAAVDDCTATPTLAPFSVLPGQYARFACTMFDEWVRHDVGKVYVQLFDSTLARWVGQPPGVCFMAETCGHAAAIEADGDLYSCDHFVFPEYRLGNIREQTLSAFMYSPRQRAFGLAKRDKMSAQCKECPWRFACNGGCPKDRFLPDHRNYLCDDFRTFFSHVAPAMDYMAGELMHQRPPANVMEWIRRAD